MLNDNLSRVRKERGLTQEALSVKLNVVRQTVSKWENGTAVPDADMLCSIADALDVSVAELLGRPDEKDEMEQISIARILAEINEQLAVQNRKKVIPWGLIITIFGIIGNAVLLLIQTVYFPYDHYDYYMDDVWVKGYEGFIGFLLNHNLVWLAVLFCILIVIGLCLIIIRKIKERKQNK